MSNKQEKQNGLIEVLKGEEKPSPKQVLWILHHLAASFDEGKSFSRIMEDAYGVGNQHMAVCGSAGQYVNNALLCCRESKEAMKEFNGCWS